MRWTDIFAEWVGVAILGLGFAVGGLLGTHFASEMLARTPWYDPTASAAAMSVWYITFGVITLQTLIGMTAIAGTCICVAYVEALLFAEATKGLV